MVESDLFEIVDPVLRALGTVPEGGEEFGRPPLDVLRYYRRSVRLHWMPVLGRALSVVAVVRQPVDIGFSKEGYRGLLTRLAMAVNGRFPPWRSPRALAVGLTALILTPEPIRAEDDATLGTVLGSLPRQRAVPVGLFRMNLGQEAVSFALSANPDGLFSEPEQLADALTTRFRRFVPLLEL
ncbi:MAG: hypothetical protein P4L84_00960 [Isosphaeraceae bacterium]|nr:hypothetical protein [Isosphaeraceae bacterium]